MSSSTDQTATMNQILEAIQTLQLNQTQLASNVDAIAGRVNVLAGMKEVRDNVSSAGIPAIQTETRDPADQVKTPESVVGSVPKSPSLLPSQLDGEKSSTAVFQTRKPTATSRIILTYAFLQQMF